MLCLWSALFVAVSKCMLFLFYFFLNFFFQLFTQRECVEVLFCFKFQVLRKRTNVIGSFPEHPVYSNFEMFSVLILGPSFWFTVAYPKSMCKSNLVFVNLGALRRKKKILPLSWSTLYIAISKCIVCWFYFFNFNFSLFTQNACMKVIYSWNFRCSPKEAVILLLSWSTLYIAILKSIVL